MNRKWKIAFIVILNVIIAVQGISQTDNFLMELLFGLAAYSFFGCVITKFHWRNARDVIGTIVIYAVGSFLLSTVSVLNYNLFAVVCWYSLMTFVCLILRLLSMAKKQYAAVLDEYRKSYFMMSLWGYFTAISGLGIFILLPLVYPILLVMAFKKNKKFVESSSMNTVLLISSKNWHGSFFSESVLNTPRNFFQMSRVKKIPYVNEDNILLDWNSYRYMYGCDNEMKVAKAVIHISLKDEREEKFVEKNIVDMQVKVADLAISRKIPVCVVVTGVETEPEWAAAWREMPIKLICEYLVKTVDGELREFLAGDIRLEDLTSEEQRQRDEMYKCVRAKIQTCRAQLEKLKMKGFLYETISTLEQQYSPVEAFYQIFGMLEYIFHYGALLSLTNKNVDMSELSPGFGLWANLASEKFCGKTRRCDQDAVVNAYNQLVKVCSGRNSSKQSCSYAEMIQLMIELRNKYIGHGSMAFSVSDELICYLLEILQVMIECYGEYGNRTNYNAVMMTPEPVILLNAEDEWLSFWDEIGGKKVFEYLNYRDGSITRIGERYTVDLDQMEVENE